MQLNDTQEMIQEAAKRFATEEIAPHAAAFDEYKNKEKFMENLASLSAMGFSGLNIREEYGGAEAGSIAYALAIEEIAYACASTAVTISINNMVAEVIQSVGSEAIKQTHLPKLMDGTYRTGAFCLTEACAGSDPAGMQMKATEDGDSYILNGSKIYITSGEYADLMVVWAKSDASAPRGKGITCFVVTSDMPGVKVGKAEVKTGQNMSATNEIHFENVRIPKANILGDEHEGFRIAVKELTGGRIGIAALSLGVGRAAMDAAIAHTKEREQFGKKLSEMQAIQWMAVDAMTALEASKLLIWNAARLKEAGNPYAKEASMAKVFASEAAGKATDTAVQMLGGAGYIKEYGVERFARDVRITRIYEGTSEIQRMIIARHIFA